MKKIKLKNESIFRLDFNKKELGKGLPPTHFYYPDLLVSIEQIRQKGGSSAKIILTPKEHAQTEKLTRKQYSKLLSKMNSGLSFSYALDLILKGA